MANKHEKIFKLIEIQRTQIKIALSCHLLKTLQLTSVKKLDNACFSAEVPRNELSHHLSRSANWHNYTHTCVYVHAYVCVYNLL